MRLSTLAWFAVGFGVTLLVLEWLVPARPVLELVESDPTVEPVTFDDDVVD